MNKIRMRILIRNSKEMKMLWMIKIIHNSNSKIKIWKIKLHKKIHKFLNWKNKLIRIRKPLLKKHSQKSKEKILINKRKNLKRKRIMKLVSLKNVFNCWKVKNKFFRITLIPTWKMIFLVTKIITKLIQILINN